MKHNSVKVTIRCSHWTVVQRLGGFVKPPKPSFSTRRGLWSASSVGTWTPLLTLAALFSLLFFQAWAYSSKLPLSLGPRVILQPWLLQHGFVQYQNIADLHTPLMPLTLAALTPLVPDGLALARLTLVALITLTALLTFVLGRRMVGWPGGLWAAYFFVLCSPAFGYGKLWHETFLAPLYLLLALVFDASDSPRSFRSILFLGFFSGVAMLVKQHAAVVFLGLVSWSAFTGWYARRPALCILREIGLMALAASLPLLAYTAYQYAQSGTLEGFLYWTIVYNLSSGYESLAAQPATLVQVLRFASTCLTLPVAIYGLVDAKRKGDKTWLQLGWLLLLLLTSSVTIYPRFASFHLQAALPVLAVVSALALAWILRKRNRHRWLAPGIVLALSLIWLLAAGRDYWPVVETDKPQIVVEYSTLVPLAQEIKQQIGPDGCAYIFPDDEATSNLYYLMGCTPPNFWIFHYPWYMLDWIQARILLTLQAHPPEWVVYLPGRWDIEAHAPQIVDYLEVHYRREASAPWTRGEVWLLKRLP